MHETQTDHAHSPKPHVFTMNSKKLFLRTSARITDTKVMAMIHGHSNQFKSFRHSLGTEDDAYCNLCIRSPDTNMHQLLHCPKYNAASLRHPLQNLSDDPSNFMWTLLITAVPEQITCFRSMAQIVMHNPKLF